MFHPQLKSHVCTSKCAELQLVAASVPVEVLTNTAADISEKSVVTREVGMTEVVCVSVTTHNLQINSNDLYLNSSYLIYKNNNVSSD